MKRNTAVAGVMGTEAGAARIKKLEEQLALAPARGRQHRSLRLAIGIQADAYRRSLDAEQAAATHDKDPLAMVGLRPLDRRSVSRKPAKASARRSHSR